LLYDPTLAIISGRAVVYLYNRHLPPLILKK